MVNKSNHFFFLSLLRVWRDAIGCGTGQVMPVLLFTSNKLDIILFRNELWSICAAKCPSRDEFEYAKESGIISGRPYSLNHSWGKWGWVRGPLGQIFGLRLSLRCRMAFKNHHFKFIGGNLHLRSVRFISHAVAIDVSKRFSYSWRLVVVLKLTRILITRLANDFSNKWNSHPT